MNYTYLLSSSCVTAARTVPPGRRVHVAGGRGSVVSATMGVSRIVVCVAAAVCVVQGVLGDGWHGYHEEHPHVSYEDHHHHVKTVEVTKKVPVPYPVTVYKKVGTLVVIKL